MRALARLLATYTTISPNTCTTISSKHRHIQKICLHYYNHHTNIDKHLQPITHNTTTPTNYTHPQHNYMKSYENNEIHPKHQKVVLAKTKKWY